jgi:hypothetical protein
VIEPDKNQLVIADPTGAIAVTHDKQHPAPSLEPRPEKGTPPALLPGTPLPFCAVQCVDLDYPDLIRPVSRARGVLAVPVDDWKEITGMHHRSAVCRQSWPGSRSCARPAMASHPSTAASAAWSPPRTASTGPVVLGADVRAAHPGKAASQTLSAAA